MAENSARRRGPGRPFKPGQSGNPGGAPVGKRISTWMVELGQLSDAQLRKLEKDPDLPLNAKIAIARIRAALGVSGGRDTEILLERTEGKVPQPIEGEITETKRIVLIFPEGSK